MDSTQHQVHLNEEEMKDFIHQRNVIMCTAIKAICNKLGVLHTQDRTTVIPIENISSNLKWFKSIYPMLRTHFNLTIDKPRNIPSVITMINIVLEEWSCCKLEKITENTFKLTAPKDFDDLCNLLYGPKK